MCCCENAHMHPCLRCMLAFQANLPSWVIQQGTKFAFGQSTCSRRPYTMPNTSSHDMNITCRHGKIWAFRGGACSCSERPGVALAFSFSA